MRYKVRIRAPRKPGDLWTYQAEWGTVHQRSLKRARGKSVEAARAAVLAALTIDPQAPPILKARQ